MTDDYENNIAAGHQYIEGKRRNNKRGLLLQTFKYKESAVYPFVGKTRYSHI